QGAGGGRGLRHAARRRERRRRRVGAPRRHAPRHAAHARATQCGDQETLMNYRIISADDHIDLQWLPKDLWQKRVSASWRGRAPKVVETPEGPFWFCGDDRWDPWGGRRGAAGAQGGRRTALERGGVLEPGVLRPTTTELRLQDMDRDGIDATVMYGPIVPLLIQEPELRRVCYRAYNEWLAEFCASAPDRLIGAGLIPIDDPKTAADEDRYLQQLGLRTGMLLAARVELPLWDEAWQPLWEAAAETELPVGFHLGGGLRTVAFSGPKAAQAGHRGGRVVDLLGDDRVMWASDYPHADSTWPESERVIEANFKGVTAQARRRILCDNARDLYGL